MHSGASTYKVSVRQAVVRFTSQGKTAAPPPSSSPSPHSPSSSTHLQPRPIDDGEPALFREPQRHFGAQPCLRLDLAHEARAARHIRLRPGD
jgi:hypothetical protein